MNIVEGLRKNEKTFRLIRIVACFLVLQNFFFCSKLDCRLSVGFARFSAYHRRRQGTSENVWKFVRWIQFSQHKIFDSSPGGGTQKKNPSTLKHFFTIHDRSHSSHFFRIAFLYFESPHLNSSARNSNCLLLTSLNFCCLNEKIQFLHRRSVKVNFPNKKSAVFATKRKIRCRKKNYNKIRVQHSIR